jgi:hypothetical protein
LLVLFACAVSLGGWLVVGPAMATHTPRAADPPVDVETPAGRARLDALIALARMPDEAVKPGAAASSAAAASGVADDGSRCGEDQRAVYAEPKPDPDDGAIHLEMPEADPDGVVRRMPGEIKPAGVGFTGAMARIDAALRTSADPFDRSMADYLDLNRITPPAARVDALVQDALAVSDARVYRLAYANCHNWVFVPPTGSASPETSPGCARLSATRWAQLDPGNAEPLLWALADADKRGDVAAQHEAMVQMASSSRMDVHFAAGAAAVGRLQMPDADLAAQSTATVQALTLWSAPASALTSRCRNHAGGDAALEATCSRIAALFYDHSDSVLWRNLGGALHRLLTDDASWLDRSHQEQRQASALVVPASDSAPCGTQRAQLRYFVRVDKIGEVALFREALRAASAP